MRLLLKIVIYAIAVLLITSLLPGVKVDSFGTSLVVGFGLILFNATLGAFFKLITLPINFVTLGCFSFVINAVVLLVVDQLVAGFSIDSFTTALFFSLIFAVVTGIMEGVLLPKHHKRR